jgi:hypothetical protein
MIYNIFFPFRLYFPLLWKKKAESWGKIKKINLNLQFFAGKIKQA